MRAGAVRLVLTGETGSGKTRTCKAVADALRDRGWNIAGVISLGVWVRDEKVAIDALDLRSGEVRRLAERAGMGDAGVGPATPGWHFHAGTLAWCNSLLANAGDADLLVVDELGPLELEQGRGWMQGIRAADAGRFRMGLLVVRPRLLPLARTRWPDALILGLGDPTEVPGKVHEVLHLADPPGACALRAL
jgi:energy-coupling factor transporter ATP-binding protein EcfA2